MPTSLSKPLASWDAAKQDTYRKANADKVLTFHFVFDASPSMHGTPATNLRKAHALYLAWLQRHADPMSLVEVSTFATTLKRQPLTALGECQTLTDETYNPLGEGGTALYAATGQICTTPQGTGQHVLVVFTDGQDNASIGLGWTTEKVAQILTTLQTEEDWLAVFLGAGIDALGIGQVMGFTKGNCLAFPTDQIPEAFAHLTKATEQYLVAPPEERKLIAKGGIF